MPKTHPIAKEYFDAEFPKLVEKAKSIIAGLQSNIDQTMEKAEKQCKRFAEEQDTLAKAIEANEYANLDKIMSGITVEETVRPRPYRG